MINNKIKTAFIATTILFITRLVFADEVALPTNEIISTDLAIIMGIVIIAIVAIVFLIIRIIKKNKKILKEKI
jgi:hypothetical protein